MEEKNIHDDLAAIRSVMERSTKFISLSGLSGILAGAYALIGAAIAYLILYGESVGATEIKVFAPASDTNHIVLYLTINASAVLIASLLTGYILTKRKAKRKNQAVWGRISRSLLFSLAVPLVSGGILIFILLLHGHYGIVAPASLIFYGLSLVSAGNFTFTLVKYLGLCEIALGLIAACLPGYGLLFWAIGFGVMHIIYGSMMYLRYDR
jgi:general stress protein CsbA